MKGLATKVYFNRSLFRKLLLSYFVTILIPTLLIISVYAYTMKEDLLAQIEQSSEAGTQRVSKNIETVIDQINSFSLQLSFIPSVNTWLQNAGEFSMFDYYQLKEQVRNQIVPNNLFHSVYIFASARDKVITTNEGLFDASSFYDHYVVEQIHEKSGSSTWWYQVRKPPAEAFRTPAASDNGGEFVTFYKSIPVTAVKPLGTLVINIPKDVFLSTLSSMSNGADSRTVILDGDGFPISRFGPAPDAELNALAERAAGSGLAHMGKVRIDGTTYFARSYSVAYNGWKVVSLTPYRLYQDRLFGKLTDSALIVVLVSLIGLAVSYGYAVKMYNPWKKIVEALTGTAGKRLMPPARAGSDEISIVSGAIDSMIETIKRNEPVVKDHLISDILQNNLLDKESIPIRLEQLGLSFAEPGYLVIVSVFDFAVPEHADDPQRKLVMFSLVSESLQKRFSCEGTILDGNKLGFIVNLNASRLDDELKDRINACYADMSAMAREQLNASLQLFVGEVCPVGQIHTSYEHLRRELNYKAVMASSEVIFVQEQQNESKFVYPLSMQKQLIQRIVSLDRERAEACIGELFEQYIYDSKYSHEKLQGMIVVLMGSIVNELLKEGYDVWSLNEEVGIFKLDRCRNNDELRQFLSAHIDRVITFLEAWQDRKNTNWYVSKAIAYMETHFSTNMSISDIAEHVGVSGGHLSRTFKAETGKSMLEYLTEFRMTKSKELLARRNDSLHEISQALGYNDVQSFIRFFKKYEGVTPGEYRKSIVKT
ncbi:helix-turn-helix domain-containing protein [Paenibacillus flagellatus]|uniref:HTH araC/xylS-type domain-containing protein n=1 Tax=Paenibacillus flagellatus TaxID=2211139 RepID=A0A2V5KC34_9BACL|nr:helix-turn-helix domain-containing protein [Paenibacillus flagellatus]PYI55714.1 hypothetical protein DLM86_08290 [Paenibacillus flagellatus]